VSYIPWTYPDSLDYFAAGDSIPSLKGGVKIVGSGRLELAKKPFFERNAIVYHPPSVIQIALLY